MDFLDRDYHGVVLPCFSTRRACASGVGEFLDLIPLIEWLSSVNCDILQLLPLNDSGNDSSPYSALSAHALHPLNISLWALPFLDEVPQSKKMLQELSVCNSSVRFCYQNVLRNKEEFLKYYFDHVFEKIKRSDSFQKFVEKHNYWLDIYCSFRVLKNRNEQKPWWEWKEKGPVINGEKAFYQMIQFFAFSQFEEVKSAARRYGVFVKGDIPILINKDSADVWHHTHLFSFGHTAGAPPDMFNEDGQNWGFPLYCWKEHEKDHFSWWKERLKTAENLYDLFRIDHIVGFFRIFAIKAGDSAKEGFFIPNKQSEWEEQGKKLLSILKNATSMFPVGEDLGSIPPSVRSILKDLSIPGTKVIRWERKWDTDGSFIPLSDYPKESMSTLSTHDTEPVSLWWHKRSGEVGAFCAFKRWEYEHTLSFERRLAILQDCHKSGSKLHINPLEEYLALFPELSFEDPCAQRVNVPGTSSEWNWTYRTKPFLEEITAHKELHNVLKSLFS